MLIRSAHYWLEFIRCYLWYCVLVPVNQSQLKQGNLVLFGWDGIRRKPGKLHPDDIAIARSLPGLKCDQGLPGWTSVARVLGKEKGYYCLDIAGKPVRIKLKRWDYIFLARRVPYFVGDCVDVSDRGYTGTISNISWHHKRDAPIYHLVVNGKQKTKWYWEKDFTLLARNGFATE